MLFRPLLPDPVAVAEGDPAGVEPEAWPEAVEPVARAVRHRQQEYVCARVLARELLASHGHPGHWVRAHADRSPTWPEGVVGAITHTSRRDAPGRVAVAVTRDPGIRGLGLDVEPDLPLPDGVAGHVEFPGDRSGGPSRLVFSAKEAVYKAIYPLHREFWGFDAVRVDARADGRLFVELRRAAPGLPVGTVVEGRWRAAEGFLGTAFVIGPPLAPGGAR